MAKIVGPDFFALHVRDLEASKQFYTEKLGLQVAPESPPDAVVFRTEPFPFAIRKAAVNLDEVEKLGWGVTLWLKCDDADALYTSLAKEGVPIVHEPKNGPFGRFFSFIEPNGYSLTVHGAN